MTDVPKGWEIRPLAEVCEILDSRRIPINTKERNERIDGKNRSELFPYYGATGQVGVIDGYLFEGEHILIGEDGAPFLDPSKHKAYLVSGRFWVNNHAHILKSFFSDRFLCHYLNSIEYSDHVTGTTRLKLTKAALERIPVALPPLPEQHRIVAKIEALFSELDAGQNSLTQAQAQLRLYRQSLLKAAFQGRLTADWRAANPDKLESPEALLSRIRTERDARYKQALDDWQQALAEWRAGGEVGRKPAKPSRPPELHLSPEQNSNLPSGWITVTVEGLLQEPLSNGRSVKDLDGGFPVLRLSAFNSGRLDLSAWKPGAWTSDEAAPWIVQEGDFFAARGNGSKHLVGIGALAVDVSEPVAYPDTMIRLSLDGSVVAPEYFLFVWNSRVMRDQIESAARTTAGIYKINQTHICGFLFPLPPREEQDAILGRLSPTLSQIEHLEIEITTALAKIAALHQSILKQAFSGRLVPQDPADEPASALLARLRANDNAATPTKRRKKQA